MKVRITKRIDLGRRVARHWKAGGAKVAEYPFQNVVGFQCSRHHPPRGMRTPEWYSDQPYETACPHIKAVLTSDVLLIPSVAATHRGWTSTVTVCPNQCLAVLHMHGADQAGILPVYASKAAHCEDPKPSPFWGYRLAPATSRQAEIIMTLLARLPKRYGNYCRYRRVPDDVRVLASEALAIVPPAHGEGHTQDES